MKLSQILLDERIFNSFIYFIKMNYTINDAILLLEDFIA
jgi:hypothetical protein